MLNECVEEAVSFECEGSKLFGILTHSRKVSDIGVIVVVGGPQYRVGSHRQFVQLGRAIAKAGYSVLRFDVRGMGDSEGEKKDFQSITNDIAAAKEFLIKSTRQIKKIVLWGLCDGASAALLYYHDLKDEDLVGLCLVNPWIRSEQSLAINTIKHYYIKRITKKEFWKKIIKGKIKFQSAKELINNLIEYIKYITIASKRGENKSYQDRMKHSLELFNRPVFIILSENDFIAMEYIDYENNNRSYYKRDDLYTKILIKNSDHTFTKSTTRLKVEEETIKWLRTI